MIANPARAHKGSGSDETTTSGASAGNGLQLHTAKAPHPAVRAALGQLPYTAGTMRRESPTRYALKRWRSTLPAMP